MLMTKTQVLAEQDVFNYTVDLLADDGARRSTFVAAKVRLRPGLSVAFDVSLVARAGGPVPVLSITENWSPEQPKHLAGESLRKYMKTRAKVIREAREVGKKLGAVHTVMFHYFEPPAAWRGVGTQRSTGTPRQTRTGARDTPPAPDDRTED